MSKNEKATKISAKNSKELDYDFITQKGTPGHTKERSLFQRLKRLLGM